MDISSWEGMVYPLRFLWRVLVILMMFFLVKGFFEAEQPQAYIHSPQTQIILEEMEWRATQIKKAAQDLPGSLEVMLRRIFSNGKPATEAKSV